MQQDLERIIKKQKLTHRGLADQIDLVIHEIRASEGDYAQLKERLQNLKPLTQVKHLHNDCYAYYSKMGKNMEKLFQKNLQYGQEGVDLDHETMIELIKIHLLREGEFDAYNTLVEEGDKANSAFHSFFHELQEICRGIKERNLDHAIQWAEQHGNLPLLFQLLKQKFIHIVQTQGKEQAVAFAREKSTFKRFSSTNLFDIQQLMTSLAFYPQNQSKYAYLYDENNWQRLLNYFLEEATKAQNLLNRSELKTIFTAGCLALPKLIKYNAITRARQSETIANEIPIDIEIGKEFKFHSFFVCPVTREVTLPTNPPMLLKCGHVVSQHSVEKMTQNKMKFKCPTCPVESKLSELKQLTFI